MNLKHLFLLLLLPFLTNNEVYSQSKQESGLIKITTLLKNNTYSIKELTKDSVLLFTGKLSSKEPEIRHGKFYFYDNKGKISVTGEYNQDIPIGHWIYYSETGDTLYKIDYSKVLNYLANDALNYSVDTIAIKKFKKKDKEFMNPDGIFIVVEEMPEYNSDPSGNEFKNYIKQTMKYPIYAKIMGIEGTVFVQCIIDTNGKIKNPTILRPIQSDLNMEAIRILSESPVWKPGFQKKIPVNVALTIPIIFKLNR